MKLLNLSTPDDVWKAARIEAARHNTSLSGLVRACRQARTAGLITETNFGVSLQVARGFYHNARFSLFRREPWTRPPNPPSDGNNSGD